MSPFDFKYDPEDLESLLLHKRFHELYPEEKTFVLQYISSEEEYSSMRATLLKVQEVNDDGYISARPETKEHLMKLFQEEKQTSGFKLWLNTVFFPFFAKRQGAVGLSFAVISAIVFSLLILFNDPTPGRLAMVNDTKSDRLEFPEERKTNEIESPFKEKETSLNNSDLMETAPSSENELASNPTPTFEPISDQINDSSEDYQEFINQDIVIEKEDLKTLAEAKVSDVNNMLKVEEEAIDLDEVEVNATRARSSEIAVADHHVSQVQTESITTLSNVPDASASGLNVEGNLFEINSPKYTSNSMNIRAQSSLIECLYTAY